MHARHQLNTFYSLGCLLAAASIGLMLQSWLAFTVALAIVLAITFRDGGIRLTKSRGPSGRVRFKTRSRTR
jgi:multisubunit Na+/H+ antiporter MnhG subunit